MKEQVKFIDGFHNRTTLLKFTKRRTVNPDHIILIISECIFQRLKDVFSPGYPLPGLCIFTADQPCSFRV